MEFKFRFLDPDEGHLLTEAIRAAYGDSYDARWVYDPGEVRSRLRDGRYVSCVAVSPDGEVLCHTGLSRARPGDSVAHSGQAVTLPEARGHHLFTQAKQHLLDRARADGVVGVYSEATAAHPYSQKANVDLGALETGFLLGWIPASVENDAAKVRGSRQSAALLYKKLNDGQPRPAYAPPRHREVIERTIELCGLRARPSDPGEAAIPDRSRLSVEEVPGHGLSIAHVEAPGADLREAISAVRQHAFHHGQAAIYVDLPLEEPGTALLADQLEELGVSYCGIFPNSRADGDVLRMQSLHRVQPRADDIAVASDHGRELLEYVLADLGATRPA